MHMDNSGFDERLRATGSPIIVATGGRTTPQCSPHRGAMACSVSPKSRPVSPVPIASKPPLVVKPVSSSKHPEMDQYTSVMRNTVKGIESNITLWQFLLELLLSNQYHEIIQWTSNEGEFKLVNAEDVAKLWGLRKNKQNMNYDKLSRALRYYYDKNIIKKVMGQKFVYRFVSFPEIVKTENKIPFKEKMESLASEFGYSCLPAKSEAPVEDVKPNVQELNESAEIHREASRVSHQSLAESSLSWGQALPFSDTRNIMVAHIPSQNYRGMHDRRSISPHIPLRHEPRGIETLAARPASVHSIPMVMVSQSDYLPLSRSPRSRHSSPTVGPDSRDRSPLRCLSASPHMMMKHETTRHINTSTISTTLMSRTKPDPLTLQPTTMNCLPIPSPTMCAPPLRSGGFPTALGPLSANLANIHTPMLLSPMTFPTSIAAAQRTPIMPGLHFWSSLSPLATMSPRVTSSSTSAPTHFQFPAYYTHGSQLAFSPVVTRPTIAMENLQTPAAGVNTPTIKSIAVP